MTEDRATLSQIGCHIRELPPRLLGLLLDLAAQVGDQRPEFSAAALALFRELIRGLPGHVADIGSDVLNQLLAALMRLVEVLPQAKECVGKNCHDMSPLELAAGGGRRHWAGKCNPGWKG
jgi:hypothetical protein